MNSSNESQYKHSNISVEDQPQALTPDKIPSGYAQMESGLLVRKDAGEHAVLMSTIKKEKQPDQNELLKPYNEIIELLNDQEKKALTSYNEYARDLGDPEMNNETLKKTLEIKLLKWAVDGSLKYLQDWLKQNPEHKIYMSASPNREISGKEFIESLRKFGDNQIIPASIHFSIPVNTQFSDNDYNIPEPNANGENFPISLTIWTDAPNLERNTVHRQRQSLTKIRQTCKSAYAPSLPQTLGYWHRLRQSENYGGIGQLIGEDVQNVTRNRAIGSKELICRGQRYIPELHIKDNGQVCATSSSLSYKGHPTRFVIG